MPLGALLTALALVMLPAAAPGAGPVVAFLGDSLTSGYGLSPSATYPALLERTLGFAAVNAGVSGNVTADGLARLDRDVLAHRPRVVVVALGINDQMRRIPAAQSLRNLEEICQRVRQSGARLLLVHVRPPIGQDALLAGVRGLARQYQAELVDDFLRGIITEPDSRLDRVHPNARGHQKMAERLRPVLERILRSF